MIARCDGCNRRGRAVGYPHTVCGQRYDPQQAPLARWRCCYCGGGLRAKRPGETESHLSTAVLLPEPLMTSHAYQQGLSYGATHPKGKAYVPTCLRDGQQRAEYLEGVAEGRRQGTASPKRRAGDVARERKKRHAGATD